MVQGTLASLDAGKLRGGRLGLLPGLIFRWSWCTDSKVLGLPLGVQMLQSFIFRGLFP